MSEKLHEGHRSRLRKKYEELGISKLEPHERLEMLLYFVFPRIDTNEISHRLINKFHSVDGVFSATVDELKTVEGIAEKSAFHIHYLGEFFSYINNNSKVDFVLSTVAEAADYCRKNLLINSCKEQIFALLLDKRKNLLSTYDLSDDLRNSVDIDIKNLMKKVMNSNCENVIIVHNHCDSTLLPSTNDLFFTRNIYHSLKSIRVELIDHIIINETDEYSIRNSRQLSDIW